MQDIKILKREYDRLMAQGELKSRYYFRYKTEFFNLISQPELHDIIVPQDNWLDNDIKMGICGPRDYSPPRPELPTGDKGGIRGGMGLRDTSRFGYEPPEYGKGRGRPSRIKFDRKLSLPEWISNIVIGGLILTYAFNLFNFRSVANEFIGNQISKNNFIAHQIYNKRGWKYCYAFHEYGETLSKAARSVVDYNYDGCIDHDEISSFLNYLGYEGYDVKLDKKCKDGKYGILYSVGNNLRIDDGCRAEIPLNKLEKVLDFKMKDEYRERIENQKAYLERCKKSFMKQCERIRKNNQKRYEKYNNS